MNHPFKIKLIFYSLLVLFLIDLNAQDSADTSTIKKEFSNLEEALKMPERVYKLNLSNQKITLPSDSIWAKFTNLEYLSLKNDHLTSLPAALGNLKKLRVLDLSGNDFIVLPQSLSSLENLTELLLNDEERMDINKSLAVIEKLPNLKVLQLENDNLKHFPQKLLQLKNLEQLYLNNNKLKEIPLEIKSLKNLKYLDLHDNDFRFDNQNTANPGFGIKINF